MIRLPAIKCHFENHRGMNYEYVCLSKLCQENNNQIGCLYCCEDFHKTHIKDVVAIKIILEEMKSFRQNKGYNLLNILLKGLETCQTYKELQTNFAQILAFRSNPSRFEELIDEEARALQATTAKYYERIHRRSTLKELAQKSSETAKPFITPILSFKEAESHLLNSPFSVTAIKDELATVFAFPNLSKFHESIDITIKVDKYTPSWLAVGLSWGLSKFEDKSPKHLLAISNGWISNKGSLQKSKLKFGGGDSLRVKWDKNMELLQFISSKNERVALKFENKWNDEVYLCVCLFYKGDTVHILA